ncbi:MAG: flavin-containing monooxygenase [Myxococcota bacterium]
MSATPISAPEQSGQLDVVIVGAGFAGLYGLHRLREIGFSVRVIEAGDGVGGTWYWNRYPGARCDIESFEYSYQFSEELQQEWVWKERYAAQPEILAYLNHVADRFDLRRDIQFETRVESAHFDEAASRWRIRTDAAETVEAQFCIMATGCLSSANTPHFDGMDSFLGQTFHTGRWPHEGVDFSGQSVGIIGTGSSGIQSIPLIAEEAAHLTVFQRTPNYSVPAQNHPLAEDEIARVKAEYPAFRARNKEKAFGAFADAVESGETALGIEEAEREAAYEAAWANGGLTFLNAFNDLLFDAEANDTAAAFARRKIEAIVQNPDLAEMLTPKQTLGCKRLCADTGYFETFNRENVELVDVNEDSIRRIVPTGLSTEGREFELDAIIFATGFDAMTGALNNIDIRGRAGLALREKWAEGPRTYLGLMTAGFPNLFLVTGPGSPSVLSNMVPSIEQHIEWISDCVAHLRATGRQAIEAETSAEDEWVAHVNEVAEMTLFPGCNSWYLGANVPGKPRVFMPYIGFPEYVEKCNEVVDGDYFGFHRSVENDGAS